MNKKYPLFDIYWDQSDVDAVTRIIKRGSYWAAGPEIQELEKKISDYLGVKYTLMFNSGTSALHCLLIAHGITSGEVIVPSFSFISTVNCVVLAGATPVFADIESETFGLDIKDVERKITKSTKAILPMHYAGKVCKDIKLLRNLADKHNLILIEDNAESFGAKIDGQFTGTIGHSAILSFCQNKVITTGEGGAVVTNDETIYEKLKLLRSHGRVDDKNINYFENINFIDYIDVGFNFRIPTMGAALGISQMKKIDKVIELRRKVGKYYDEHLAKIPQIQVLEEPNNQRNVYQFYALTLKDEKQREKLQKFLMDKGIFSKVNFYPIHLKTSFLNKYGSTKDSLPVTEEISLKELSLPFSLNFKPEDQDYIINLINDFFLNQ